MWTPRRLLLLVVGFALFFTTYAVYGRYIGGINGLPPLPPDYLPGVTDPYYHYVKPPKSYVDLKLEQAFGQDCDEVRKRPMKMEVGARHLYLAADKFEVLEDGRAKFTPFSIAIFGKQRPGDGFPEINTIQCETAIIQFDKPLTNSAEQVGDRHIVGGVLDGKVQVINNRRTPQRNDDLCLRTPGPVFYEERQHWIVTRQPVEIKDYQSKPEPMCVTANGMVLYLTADDKPTPGGQPQGRKAKKSENISGVERIHLQSDVMMTLFVDSHSGFLGAGAEAGGKPDEVKTVNTRPTGSVPSPKSKVIIQTLGPFDYDLITDVARFSVTHRSTVLSPDQVEVTRFQNLNRTDLVDKLLCDDFLELRFHRKGQASQASGPAPGAATPPADQSVALEIESAHAEGTQVVLTSDSEGLTASGTALDYDARRHETVLTGGKDKGMFAAKEGSEIRARELHIIGGDRKEAQQATAIGPGQLEMLDTKSGTRPVRARWQKELVWGKDGKMDLLTLTGDASFLQMKQAPKPPDPGPEKDSVPPEPAVPVAKPDEPPEQELDADCLQVWLKDAPAASATSGGQHRTPHHVVATGNVRAASPDMRVHDAERMVIVFRDLEPFVGPPAPAAVPKKPEPAASGAAPFGPAGPPSPPAPPRLTPAKTAAPATAAPTTPPPAQKPKNPMDLTARSIEARVLRTGNKNELEKLRCEGAVHVTQEPSGPDDKGVDIRGQTLSLDHFPEEDGRPDGNRLVVTADHDKGKNELAYVQMDRITILGNVVTIDQVKNEAEVWGVGSMKMPSTTDFEGQKLSQTKDLTVYWNDHMLFGGKNAEFEGGVIASMDLPEEQKRKQPPNADTEIDRLACQKLAVTLDQAVSLRQTKKDPKAPPAKVDHLVCDKQVRTEESTYQMGRLREYKRIVSPELDVDNIDGKVQAPGPGLVYILQMGARGEDLPMAPSPTKPAKPAPTDKPADEEMKLTRVAFEQAMTVLKAARTAIFYGNVEVVHLAADDPDVVVDITKPLPKGAMYMRSDHLKVQSCRNPDGKTSHQEMEANNHVLVQSPEFWGRGDRVTYDESKELVIFEGQNGNLASLYRENPGRGGARGVIKSRKIYYWRRTNDFKTEDSPLWRSQ